MPLTNLGKSFMVDSLLGIATTPFNEANSYIGVGNSNTSFDPAQTDLVGSSKIRTSMLTGYPKKDISDPNTLIYKGEYTGLQANFSWLEWGIFNSDNLMLLRVVEDIGIKREGSTWIFEVFITFES
jgi:hypothetical protein